MWARPAQIFGTPTLIRHFTFESITQTLVGDCSFVSSLAVCASWERRFGRTLISRNIFPQKNGVPVLSPSGKYIVKMYLNGSVRKIVIDDYLPVVEKSPSTLLCSFSNAADELWVSISRIFPFVHSALIEFLMSLQESIPYARAINDPAHSTRDKRGRCRCSRRPTSSCTLDTTFPAPHHRSTCTRCVAGSQRRFTSLRIQRGA